MRGETGEGTDDRNLLEADLREIFHSVNDAIFLHDARTGEILDVNETMTEMYGYSRAEARELTVEDLSAGEPPYTQERALEYTRRAAEGTPQVFEWLASDSAGERFWVEVNLHAARVGDEDRVLATVRDIHDRKDRTRALDRLNAASRDLMSAPSEEAVATIASDAATEILHLPLNGVHLYDGDADALEAVAWSDPVSAVFDGRPPAIRRGEGLAWQAFASGDPASYANVAEADAVMNPETPFRSELYLPLGSYGLLVIGSRTPDDFDESDAALARVLAANVEAALERVERERELRERNDRLEELTSVVSHDLRNPLGVAAGGVELARDDCDSDHLETVEHAHERMEDLIDDLLTWAKQGETVTETSPVELDLVATSCWQTVETAEATLEAEAGGTIRADQRRLQQLLENLVRNAVEHGGEDVTITVGDLDDGFYVADDGAGIPPAERETVFERGYSTSQSGTGYGLAIVRRITEAHGWDIAVTDGQGGGTRFEITGVERLED